MPKNKGRSIIRPRISPSRRYTQMPPFDEEAGDIIAELKSRQVQIDDQQDLYREHQRNLARFHRTGIDRQIWWRLRRCEGSSCPNSTCSAACAFGFQYMLNKLTLQANDIMNRQSLPKFMVTCLDPQYFLDVGQLNALRTEAMFQTVRRRIRNAPLEWRDAIAIGSVHLSIDVNLDGSVFWSPHVTMLLGVRANKGEINKVLGLRTPPDPSRIGRAFRPIVTKRATLESNAISYSVKRNVDVRVEKMDGNGVNRQDDPRKMPENAQRELDELSVVRVFGTTGGVS